MSYRDKLKKLSNSESRFWFALFVCANEEWKIILFSRLTQNVENLFCSILLLREDKDDDADDDDQIFIKKGFSSHGMCFACKAEEKKAWR